MRLPLLNLAVLSFSFSTVHAAMVYVDATGGVGGNTVNATTGSQTDWFVVNNGQLNDLWDLRTDRSFAFGSTAFQLNSAEASIVLRTDVTGLSANATYTGIRLYYIGNVSTASNRNWSMQASVVSASTGFVTYPDNDGNGLVDSNVDALGTETDALATDTRYWVSLPDVTTDSSGTFSVWVNIGEGADDRAVYDGIAYDNVAIPEPSAAVLLGVAGLSLGFAPRRR